jgi:hypothetical protein
MKKTVLEVGVQSVATSVSRFLKSAAHSIEQGFGRQTSPGIFPFAKHFEVSQGSGRARLTYSLGDINPSELYLKHNLYTVFLDIEPVCVGYLIQNIRHFKLDSVAEVADELIANFADARWDTCSAAELRRFFTGCLKLNGLGDDMWRRRTLVMLNALIDAAIYLRDHCGEALTLDRFRSILPLDAYSAMAHDRVLPERLRSRLSLYLHDLPGFNEDDFLNGSLSPKCYEQHGYLTMHVCGSGLFSWGAPEGKQRDYRLASVEIEHQSPHPITSVEAQIVDDQLIVDVVYFDQVTRKVEIKHPASAQ